MKIRNGFVSNSSSTSFIVVCNENKPCPHCGRKDMDIVDLVEQSDNHEDEVIDSGESLLNMYIDIKQNLQNSLDKISHLPDNHIIHNKFGKYTIGSEREYLNDDLQYTTKIIEQIENALNNNKQVAKIEISYHNDTLNALLNEQVDHGTITIIDESEQ